MVLVIIGALLYVVNQVVPMDAKIKLIINVVVVIAVCVWLLNALGLLDSGPVIRLHR